MEFSEVQRRAITHRDGPMMVLAGPGSGKTTVITRRVEYLVRECSVNPGDILVITFTRAAASEMRERCEKLGGNAARVSFGTFHAVFFHILKLAYRFTADSIIREDRQRQLLREMAERHHLDPEDMGELVSALLSEISTVKSEQMNLAHFYSATCADEVFREIYREYDEAMRREGLIDFDDMMVMCLELFRERKDILAAWQRRYRYILIDEFQDINRLQYEIIRMMALPENNLFIVGDDDQSIYRFRGAKPEIMLGFERDYPGAERILLDRNYRCTEEIVRASLQLIGHNSKRFAKDITSTGRHGKPVSTRVFADTAEETAAIAKEIREYIASGISPEEIAVLYRTNSDPRLLMQRLMEYNLPFRAKDQVPNLFDHWIARDILTYIRMAQGSRSREDFFRIMNRPTRYFSRQCVPEREVSFADLQRFYRDRDWMIEKIDNLEHDLRALSRMSPIAAVKYIREIIGYDRYLEAFAEEHRMKAEELTEIADELQEHASAHKTVESWQAAIEAHGEELKKQAARGKTGDPAVTLATMHGAKGLEFEVVYLLDCMEGNTPYRKAALPDDIEEERRLFYVAMTRAKTRLHVCAARERYKKPAELSRFVYEYLGKQ